MKRLLLILAVVAVSAGATRAQEMYYVIKVTPTLLYLDAGLVTGVQPKDHYLILTRDAPDGPYAPVAEVVVVRVAEGYSIAEILSRVEGRPLEVLQRAISAKEWELMAPPVEDADPASTPLEEALPPESEPTPAARVAPWSVWVVAGGEWNKGVSFGEAEVKRIADVAAGVRLGRTWSDRYRLCLGVKLAGETLGASDADVSQLGLEADLHYFFRAAGRPGPYFGLGAGMHRLSWHQPSWQGSVGDESTYKASVAGTAGLQLPIGRGAWAVVLESGYQRVLEYNARTLHVDASNVRTCLGLGRSW
jgi:hypothetical protein